MKKNLQNLIWLEALFETVELLADRDFMQAWKREQAGKTRYRPLTALKKA
jgi:hypothetical protein